MHCKHKLLLHWCSRGQQQHVDRCGNIRELGNSFRVLLSWLPTLSLDIEIYRQILQIYFLILFAAKACSLNFTAVSKAPQLSTMALYWSLVTVLIFNSCVYFYKWLVQGNLPRNNKKIHNSWTRSGTMLGNYSSFYAGTETELGLALPIKKLAKLKLNWHWPWQQFSWNHYYHCDHN